MISTKELNTNNYDDLLVSIEANNNQLNLLIAVCDNIQLQNRIIEQYSRELDLPRFEISLSPEQPSLTLALRQLVEENPELKTVDNAVITVTGLEEFELFCNLSDGQLKLKELLGYLQWTREALRGFSYSIIIWMPKSLRDIIQCKAPDFWSWRKGVFRFSRS